MILKEYKLTNLNELFGYTRLDTNRTGLNVTLMADSTRAYKIYGHMPLIFARNGYDKSIKEYIPFLIAPQSKILDPTIDLNITYSDVFAIEIFIRENFRGLRDLANEKIEDVEFIRSIKPFRRMLNESSSLIMEMGRLKPKDTNLPMDIWVDEEGLYNGHAPRIKFQASSDQTITRDFSTMTIANPPEIFNLPSKNTLRRKDRIKLERFVINNMENLLKLADGEIDIDAFKKIIVKD